MELRSLPETVVDWSCMSPTRMAGASAGASVRAHRTNDVQLRLVDYDPGYLADHWCSKGHILYVISGSLTIEHGDDKEPYELTAGMSWQTADDGSPHQVRTTGGAKVFIVD
jgi:quercetin dioxygenase-like cupin family protein